MPVYNLNVTVTRRCHDLVPVSVIFGTQLNMQVCENLEWLLPALSGSVQDIM